MFASTTTSRLAEIGQARVFERDDVRVERRLREPFTRLARAAKGGSPGSTSPTGTAIVRGRRREAGCHRSATERAKRCRRSSNGTPSPVVTSSTCPRYRPPLQGGSVKAMAAHAPPSRSVVRFRACVFPKTFQTHRYVQLRRASARCSTPWPSPSLSHRDERKPATPTRWSPRRFWERLGPDRPDALQPLRAL